MQQQHQRHRCGGSRGGSRAYGSGGGPFGGGGGRFVFETPFGVVHMSVPMSNSDAMPNSSSSSSYRHGYGGGGYKPHQPRPPPGSYGGRWCAPEDDEENEHDYETGEVEAAPHTGAAVSTAELPLTARSQASPACSSEVAAFWRLQRMPHVGAQSNLHLVPRRSRMPSRTDSEYERYQEQMYMHMRAEERAAEQVRWQEHGRRGSCRDGCSGGAQSALQPALRTWVLPRRAPLHHARVNAPAGARAPPARRGQPAAARGAAARGALAAPAGAARAPAPRRHLHQPQRGQGQAEPHERLPGRTGEVAVGVGTGRGGRGKGWPMGDDTRWVGLAGFSFSLFPCCVHLYHGPSRP